METKITGTKQKVSLTSRSELSDVFIVVTTNFRREQVTDEGTATEKVIGTDYVNGQARAQFNLKNLSELEKLNLKDLLSQAIEDAKKNH